MSEHYRTAAGPWAAASAPASSAPDRPTWRGSRPPDPGQAYPVYKDMPPAPSAPPPGSWPPATGPSPAYQTWSAPWLTAAPDKPEKWWVWWAVHGGAGVTTLSQACPLGRAPTEGTVDVPYPPVVVVCRTHASGLLAAKELAASMATSRREQPGSTSRVVGLLTVADAPGSLPKGLAQLRRHVAGGYGHAWHIRWVEAWRCGEAVTPETTPAPVRRVLARVERRVAEFIISQP
jgi:hypothetical protein